MAWEVGTQCLGGITGSVVMLAGGNVDEVWFSFVCHLYTVPAAFSLPYSQGNKHLPRGNLWIAVVSWRCSFV